ncbi:hypothetical protein B0J11DRAFT_95418 [Dendryphion nanum]|uniref:RING-type domain-containing protein n=1 Tax=Dendryphion nanum TaxID=256645 RepID=A0A9P9IDR0_9PLEO|nr:hypothetical protein B0J11DRAFT_95418 [Dendryphion nanum]
MALLNNRPHLHSFLCTLVPHLEAQEKTCSICHEPYNTADPAHPNAAVGFPDPRCCRHIFCRECIQRWLSQPHVETCPICRANVYTSMGFEEEVESWDTEDSEDDWEELEVLSRENQARLEELYAGFQSLVPAASGAAIERNHLSGAGLLGGTTDHEIVVASWGSRWVFRWETHSPSESTRTEPGSLSPRVSRYSVEGTRLIGDEEESSTVVFSGDGNRDEDEETVAMVEGSDDGSDGDLGDYEAQEDVRMHDDGAPSGIV